jgi:hypothetical protein
MGALADSKMSTPLREHARAAGLRFVGIVSGWEEYRSKDFPAAG